MNSPSPSTRQPFPYCLRLWHDFDFPGGRCGDTDGPAPGEPPNDDVRRYYQLKHLFAIFEGIRSQQLCRKQPAVKEHEIINSTTIPTGGCWRPLNDPREKHSFRAFTNQRVFQFYCTHNAKEAQNLHGLHEADDNYRITKAIIDPAKTLGPYDRYTKVNFEVAEPCLVWSWEHDFEMAALSPLDINVNFKSKATTMIGKLEKPAQKPAAPKQAKSSREKDHPPPPPHHVIEPPSKGRPDGAKYETGRLLGKGGFAICHEARLKGTNEIYALKIVKSQMPQKKMEQKFQTELQIHSKMHHPNIVEFHRAFTFEESTYIVLELCPNGSLMDMVKKRRYITEPEVRFYTVQIAAAIKYMHTKGIIHRDLKMGNIFLDTNMNVKIGDFGLAALLISGKDMAVVRRTTLCGTPNYIAPEILEKGKKGHDHAVDIWSLGIIIFAMLTGRPPFQSPTQDEIYKKARDRDYDWPAMDKCDNYICDEAKALVAIMLQPAEDRPDCDTIVQHPFFSCGYVPTVAEMTPKLKEAGADTTQFSSVTIRGPGAYIFAKNLKTLCIASNVGPWCQQEESDDVILSVYNEMKSEQKYGLTPAIPLSSDTVYRPYHEAIGDARIERAARQQQAQLERNNSDTNFPYRPAPTSRSQQSFAAQQRAQHPGSAVKPPPVPPLPAVMAAPPRRPRAQAPEPEPLPRVRSRVEETREAAPSSEATRRQRSQRDAEAAAIAATRSTRSAAGGMASAPRRTNPRTQSEEKLEQELKVEARLGAELVRDLPRPDFRDRDVTPMPAMDSMFSPYEKVEALPNSSPDDVLRRLERFQAEIQRALNSRSLGTVQKKHKDHHLVVKWVDYTNKYGLGYILNDGSVGCIFKALPTENDANKFTPPSAIVVRHGEKHLQNRENVQYWDKDQLIPIRNGKEVEFYENRGERGQYVSRVPAMQFKAAEQPGRPVRLTRGRDEWDDRKREKLVIWKKFANYMTVFGREDGHPRDEPVGRIDSEPHNGMVVTFYQRLGDVGIWGFYDGSFQFNFPDHTKLILSADGSWCDFYHLPLEAARDLAETGSIPPSALDERQHLSHSVQEFLNFLRPPSSSRSRAAAAGGIDPMIQGIPTANDFKRKIQFVNAVVSEWIANGGIGASAMDTEMRLRWMGYRELHNTKVPYKHVWVTVGGARGDDRRVAWFDPRDPTKIMPDIEQPR